MSFMTSVVVNSVKMTTLGVSFLLITFTLILLQLSRVFAVIGAPVFEPRPTAAAVLTQLSESLSAVAAASFEAVLTSDKNVTDFALSPPLILADVAMAYLDGVAGGGNEAKYCI